MSEDEPRPAETKPRIRWFHLTPHHLLVGLMVIEGLLLLAKQFRWFPENWPVLFAVAAIAVTMLLMLPQFSFASFFGTFWPQQRKILLLKRLMVLVGLIVICAGVLVYRVWFVPVAAEIVADEAITVDGSVRHYRLVIPRRLPQERVPIVFAFHGIGDSTTEEMAAYSGLDRLAAEKGFVLVYPVARNHMWATMDIDPRNLDRNPDVRFFDQLLGHLGNRFRLDPNRIYLVGMSNGASFAQLLAFARPGVAAVVAHSGTRPFELMRAIRPFPILLLAGEGREKVPATKSREVAGVGGQPGVSRKWGAGKAEGGRMKSEISNPKSETNFKWGKRENPKPIQAF